MQRKAHQRITYNLFSSGSFVFAGGNFERCGFKAGGKDELGIGIQKLPSAFWGEEQPPFASGTRLLPYFETLFRTCHPGSRRQRWWLSSGFQKKEVSASAVHWRGVGSASRDANCVRNPSNCVGKEVRKMVDSLLRLPERGAAEGRPSVRPLDHHTSCRVQVCPFTRVGIKDWEPTGSFQQEPQIHCRSGLIQV